MFSNDETGSWTLTVTMPGGPTCVMNSGEHFFQETYSRRRRTGVLRNNAATARSRALSGGGAALSAGVIRPSLR